jgi:hypothetical protein
MRRIIFFLSLGLCLACSGHRQAGTGDIAFRLVWDGQSDLDLFVEDPAGTCIFYGHRDSATGGLLDVDCNGASDRVCESPVENVYWPAGTAPAGTYTYWLEAHSVIPAEAPLSYELQLLRGAGVTWRHTGELQKTAQIIGPFQVDFATGRMMAPLAADRRLPDCPLRSVGRYVEEGEGH